MKFSRQCLLICTFLLGVTKNCVAQSTMVPWLTRSVDNSRSGWNSHETQLTQASVEFKGIVRATIIPLIGDARGMEAQPLILPNVKTALGTRDVMVLPSMANVVRGVDAHDGSAIWQTPQLGTPVTAAQDIDRHQINEFWGCLSTGVIDAETQRLYQVCWIAPDKPGTPQKARYFMFVLSMTDGSQVVPPVLIQGTSGTQDFNATMRKQRSSLVETNIQGVKTVFGCSGTINETRAGVASGYCFASDVATNTVSAMLALTSGEGAGVWMAGQGRAAQFYFFSRVWPPATGPTKIGDQLVWLAFLRLAFASLPEKMESPIRSRQRNLVARLSPTSKNLKRTVQNLPRLQSG